MSQPSGVISPYYIRLQKRLKRISLASGIITVLIAFVALTGWNNYLHSYLLLSPAFTVMSPISAFCFLLAGMAVILLIIWPSNRSFTLFSIMVGAILVLISLVRLLNIDKLHPDVILFPGNTGEGQVVMTNITGIGLLFIGTAFLFKAFMPGKSQLLQYLLFAILVFSFFTFICIVDGVESDYPHFGFFKMRIGSTICFLLLSVSLLAGEYNKGIMGIITSNKTGGRMARKFLPVVILFPILIGVIDRLADNTDWFPDSLALTIFSLLMMVIFFVIVLRSAGSSNNIHNWLLQEIEERKKAEEEARTSNVFVNAIYENIPSMVFVKEGDELRYKSINKAGEVLIGHTRQELLGKGDHDFFPKEEADFFRAKDKEVFASDKPVIAEEPITTPEYGLRWLRTKKIAIRDESGNPLYMIGISEDITELKEKEEKLKQYYARLELEVKERTHELRKSEEQYHRMVEEVEDYAILLLDPRGNVVNWNKGAERINGYKAEEIIGKSFETFYTQEDKQGGLPSKLLSEAKTTGRSFNEGWRVKKDGTLFWASVVLTAVMDEDKNLIGFSKVTRDITESKAAHDLLLENELRFRDLTQNVPGVIYQWIERADGSSGFAYVSPKLKDYFGLEPEDIGKLSEYIHPDDKEVWRKSIEEQRLHRKPWFFEGRLIFPDGRLMWLRGSSVVSMKNENGTIYNGLLMDITQQKLIEQKSKEQEEQIRLFVKHTPAAVAMFDDQMRYMVASDRWYNDYGLVGREIIGKSHYEIFPEIDQLEEWKVIHRHCLAGAVELREQDAFLRTDGTVEWLRWEIHPWKINNDHIGGIIMFTEVITERIKAREHLELLNKQLTESNRDLEQFAYVASHDLQEPLRMVSSFLQLLEKKYSTQLDEKAQQYIHFAVNGSERMKALIDDLLKFSRVGTASDERTMVDCNEVVKTVIMTYTKNIKKEGAVINVSPLPVLKGNKTQLEQLFQNLIGNALKYRRPDPLIIDIGCEADDSKWVFYVKDNGIGIDGKFFEKVFVIFQRLHGKDEYSGTGIGLAICKKIVERHGGRIWIESVPNKGATFYFSFPGNQAFQ